MQIIDSIDGFAKHLLISFYLEMMHHYEQWYSKGYIKYVKNTLNIISLLLLVNL